MDDGTGAAMEHVEGVRVDAHTADRGAGRLLRGSRSLRAAIGRDADAGAILHAHGLWLFADMYPAWTKRGHAGTRLVHSTRGMLAPAALRISRWKKWPVWWLWQQQALRQADCLHATAESEYAEIRNMGLRNAVAVVPNGIDVPEFAGDAGRPAVGMRTILSLGRIHRKKALDQLVRAWAGLEEGFPNWRVRIVGPAEGDHDRELRDLATSLGVKRLSIEGAVYDDEKAKLYRACDLFVLPTLNENFGVAVAEALAAGLPVISSKGAPWSGLETHRCGWWVEHGVDALASALGHAMILDDKDRWEMGRRGRAWMQRDFSWDSIAAEMLSVYAWLQTGGRPPATVRLA